MASVVSSGQVIANVTINNEQEIISSGGTGKFQTVSSNGQILVKSGGTLIETDGVSDWFVESGGQITIESGGTVIGGEVQSGATYYASNGASVTSVTIMSGGTYRMIPEGQRRKSPVEEPAFD